MPADFFRELFRRNRQLAALGWIHAGLFALTLALWMIDDRQVMGINAWIKPAKFMASLALYLWTIAWISEYIQRPRWAINAITWTIFVVIVLETACLLLQAARGTTSHYNIDTEFDAMVFSSMGALIGIDMLMTVAVLLMFARPSAKLHPAYLWGIRLGVVIFLYGGWIGGQMIQNGAHTVGAPDGGPGLPVLDWSTIAGDLRIAHGLGLHALQIVPLFGWWVSRWSAVKSDGAKLAVVMLFALVYALAVFGSFRQAMAGLPAFGA